MSGFGGAVKLTGESEYRRALQQITQSLKEVDSELKLVASQYGKNDDSQEALISKTDTLTKKLEAQKDKVRVLAENYKDLSEKAEINNKKHADLKAELDKATKDLEEIAKESGKASSEYKTQASYVSELSNEYKKSTTNINNQETALSKARTELNNATSEMNKTESELKELGDEFSNTANDADELGDAAKDAGEKAEKSANGGWTVLKGVLADLASSAIQGVLGELRSLASEAIEASDSLDKFATTMSFAGYDSATIEQAQADVKRYADETVYNLDTIANTSAQLAANGIEDFQGLTEAAGNLNAVAGGNADTFQSVAMVLTQTAGAGKLTTENWNQLANAIPGASGVLQQALLEAGAYTGDFREAMSEGQITAEEFNDAIMKLGSDPVAVEASKSVSTFEGAVGNLRANVVNGFMQIYDAVGKENITSALTGISDLISEIIPPLVEAVTWFIDNLPAIAPILGAIAGALITLMVAEKINALVTAFQAWRAATEGMTVAQALLNAVMNANPIMLIVTLLGALIAALVVAWNTNDEFREALTSAWENIKSVFDTVWTAIEKFFTETLPETFTNCVNTVKTWITNVTTTISQLPGKIWTFLTDIVNKIKLWAIDIGTRAATAAKNFFNNIVTTVKELPGKVWEFLTDIVSKIVTWAGDIASKATNAARDFVSNIINKVAELPGDLWNKFTETLGKAADFVRDFGQKALDAGRDFFDNIIDKLDDIPGEVYDIGVDMVTGIWDGIQSKWNWLWDKIKNFGNDIVDGAKKFFGIGSPSRKMRDEVGIWLAEGVGVGFEEQMQEVSDEMNNAIPTSFDIDPTVNTDGIADIDGYGGSMSSSALVNAFIEALEGVQVEMDDVNMGKFVRKTVTDAIYT